MELTRIIADFIIETKQADIPQTVYEHAKIAFLDWVGVTMAGQNDPLVKKLIQHADYMGSHAQASILGHGIKKSLTQAALINGAASHALDYDDTLFSFLGHPSVTMFPSLLALAEYNKKSGIDFLTAYIIGFKAGAVIGECAGMDHYMHGWHATSTIGHFASCAVCCRLMGLNTKQTQYALGIAGTQASGLKISFGTMCKPFHAGKASHDGLLAAMLAKDGFTGAENILEGPLGFFQVLKGTIKNEVVNSLGKTWEIENLAQKYHASCHATHSPIEAAVHIITQNSIALEDIKKIRVFCSQLAIDAAGKTEPTTGLEGKFSIIYCVANALISGNTGMQAFEDAKVLDPQTRKLMKKISVLLDENMSGVETRLELETMQGETHKHFSDILKEIPVLEVKREKIKTKFCDLCTPVLGKAATDKLAETILSLEKSGNMKLIAEILQKPEF